jgi:UDP-N-acetylmuramate dehydrogenase
MIIEKNISLTAHTTLQLGGVADYFVVVTSVAELITALQFARDTQCPHIVLGEGSNILASDAGYRGLVIKNEIGGMEYVVEGESVKLICGAGLLLDEVIADVVTQKYWGLENLSAIPGTIGATPIQNVGAYGVEVSHVIHEVTAVHADTLETKVFSNQDCTFGYRDSFFKSPAGKKWVVTQVVFVLSATAQPTLEYGSLQELKATPALTPAHVRKVVSEIRATKFPDWKRVGTAGSFFKNPVVTNEHFTTLQKQYPDIPGYATGETHTKVSLGWILDHVCKLKGYCADGVCLYEKQALVLINQSAKDTATIETFATFVSQQVQEKTNISIEWEVTKI